MSRRYPEFSMDHTPMYLQSVTLRNLRIDEDYEKIRSKCLATGSLYRDEDFIYPTEDRFELVRAHSFVSRPMFVDGDPSRFDAIQGQLGDCWMVSAMALLTSNLELFYHVVPRDQDFGKNYFGGFHFRIWQRGHWYDVVVDDIIPVDISGFETTIAFVHSRQENVFWASLLEKAFAKINIMDSAYYHYETLEVGYAVTSLLGLTGCIVESVDITDPPGGLKLKHFLEKAYARSALMSSTFTTAKEDPVNEVTGLIANHAYPITKMLSFAEDDPDHPGLCLIRLLNPHGDLEWKGKWSDEQWHWWSKINQRIRQVLNVVNRPEGEFWIELDDFSRHFSHVAVSHLGPSYFMDSRTQVTVFDWMCVHIFGEWEEGVSAGGSDPADMHINPQYSMDLGWADETPSNPYGGIVLIDLISRSKESRLIVPSIGIFVYELKEEQRLPLKQDFFQKNKPFYPSDPSEQKFSETGNRVINVLLRYKPGTYVIVPCTEVKGEETNFFMRIFTEYKKVEVSGSDLKISRNMKTDMYDQSIYECDELIRRIFSDIAIGKDEVGWIGLKVILEKAMNPNSSESKITSLFKVFRPILEWFNGGRTTDDGCFSKDDCRTMIAMLDENHSDKLNFTEFCHLWKKIKFWTVAFERHQDETGNLLVSQLREALSSIGYDVNKPILHIISHTYANEQKRLILKDFIMCAVTIEYVLTQHLKEDAKGDGTITCNLKKWVKKTLML